MTSDTMTAVSADLGVNALGFDALALPLSARALRALGEATAEGFTLSFVLSDIVEGWTRRSPAGSQARPHDASAATWLSLSPRAAAELAEAMAPGYTAESVVSDIVEEWAERYEGGALE